ncbi:hypothetical protein PHLCEN_2v3399 [Hermanssonia centrifuga]|uniref:Uncharacterized protein n=1 Tax=Hermanssonia centrifuga TaxID=98765 RepID=A0A2R6QIU5_9APHY|nr:hypothetical protein PHLCEN_2v3399 [Hermanssonia centrifuga]
MNATQPSFISWEPEPTRRGTSNIIFTCLSTLAFCVWGSVHIDIIQSRRNALVQRLFALVLGLLSPEVLLVMAYSQRRLATKLVNEANGHFGIQVTPQMPWYRCAPPQLWSKLKAHIILWRTKVSWSL